MTTTQAVVAFSGGQDSTTCLAWALQRWGAGAVAALGFDYGQRHRVELDVAAQIAHDLGVPYRVLSVPAFRELGAAALTSPTIDVKDAEHVQGSGNVHAEKVGLPSTFVPGRNVIFLGLAAAYAMQLGAAHVVTGVCEADDAGYPDCRASFIASMNDTLIEAMGTNSIVLHAPLLHLNKASTFMLADNLGALSLVLERSHTCYEGNHETRHAWGYGCGECPACVERAKGWSGFMEMRAAAGVAQG